MIQEQKEALLSEIQQAQKLMDEAFEKLNQSQKKLSKLETKLEMTQTESKQDIELDLKQIAEKVIGRVEKYHSESKVDSVAEEL